MPSIPTPPISNGLWLRTGEPTALELLDKRAEATGDAPFLTVVGRPLSAATIVDASFALARFLAECGVRKGDRVATLFENCPEAVTAFFGAIRAGAMVVPINA